MKLGDADQIPPICTDVLKLKPKTFWQKVWATKDSNLDLNMVSYHLYVMHYHCASGPDASQLLALRGVDC